ncbi:MAG: LysE family transporter [Eubacteriales bacterium]|nr:LysE family transporter [Eubacteriales bacterium]
MPFSVLLEMTISAAITVWSPGPNNILLLSTASRYGLRRNLKLLLGIWTGSLTLMCLSGIFCSALKQIVPEAANYMKYVGAAYILYLSWGTWKRRPPSDQENDREPSYLMGLFLQLLNVKIILYGLTMFSSFILPYEQRIPMLFLFAVYLMILGAIGNLIWGLAGTILKRAYEKNYKLMNGVMALLLLWCALRIIGVF